MLIKLSASKRAWLIREDGYSLAKEWSLDAGVVWPGDPQPPKKKNHLVIIPNDTQNAEELLITSTRAITIGRELPGGKMSDCYGIVCAEDDRGRSQFVLGGGKVQPDFDTSIADRLLDGEDREIVRGGVVAENREELKVVFAERDPDAYKHYYLFGVRRITESVLDTATGRNETVLKKEDGLSVGDACFLAITHERLGYFEGQRGETKRRHVKPPSELLGEPSREDRAKGALKMLPYAQATALALAIVGAKEIFGKDMPAALAEVVADGKREAERVLERNNYATHFTKLIQEGPWEV